MTYKFISIKFASTLVSVFLVSSLLLAGQASAVVTPGEGGGGAGTPAPQSAECTVNGQRGVGTGIKVNGQNCVGLGDGSVQTNPIFVYMLMILKFLAGAVGLAVVGGIVWGGLNYLTARGNSSQTQQGITIITNSIIGLILYILMAAIVNYLVPGGIFSL